MKQQNKIKLKLVALSSFLIFTVLVLSSLNSKGQYLSANVIGAGGETFSNGSFFIDFSVGELSVESYQDQADFITQGFLQGLEGSTSVNEHQKNVQLEIYPNPVSQTLHLKYNADLKPQYYEIAGLTGQTIVNMKIDQTSCSLNVSTLKPGAYFLKLRFSDQSVSTQIFIKQ